MVKSCIIKGLPEWTQTHSLQEFLELMEEKICTKGMTKETCPYNPLLGCDCGANPPNKKQIRDTNTQAA